MPLNKPLDRFLRSNNDLSDPAPWADVAPSWPAIADIGVSTPADPGIAATGPAAPGGQTAPVAWVDFAPQAPTPTVTVSVPLTSAPELVSVSAAGSQIPATVPVLSQVLPGPIGTRGSLTLVAGLAKKTGPIPGDHATSDDTIAGRAIDAAAIVSFSASIDGGGSSDVKADLAADGSFTLTPAMLATLNGGTIAPGQHSVVLTATDAGNNAASAGVAFDLIAAAPTFTAGLETITGTSALAKSVGATSDDTVTGSATDASGIISLFGTLDGGATFSSLSGAIGNGGSITLAPSTLASLAGGTLPDGAHSLVLQATDTGGNVTTQTIQFDLLTHIGPATVALASSDQAGNPTTTGASTITLVGQADPGDTVLLASTGATTIASNAGTFRFNNIPVLVGTNQLQVTASDLASNTSGDTLSVQRAAAGGIDPTLQWNQIALAAIARNADAPTVASRSLAMESVAVYDAVAAIDGTPGYLISLPAAPNASAAAAVAEAADQVLDYLYPAQAASFDATLATSLAGIASGAAKSGGIALGIRAAQAIIAARANDGSGATVIDDGSTAVGDWRPTAPGFANAVTPQWQNVTPFGLLSGSQFVAPPPPDLDSAAYAAAVNETESLGAGDSTTRTADETQIAQFWNNQTGTFTPPGEWNSIADSMAAAQDGSTATDAQLLAELNVAEADAGIASWSIKYGYDGATAAFTGNAVGTWRPITAIQDADQIGNPAITQDSTWTPLITTPAFPEYVAGHPTFSVAAAQILDSFFGDNVAFSATSPSTPGVTRNFTSFDQAALEAGESRVYGGIHFQFSVDAGATLGQQIGDWTLQVFNQSQDTVPPKIVPDQPSGLVTDAIPTITGTVTDNLSGVASLTASVDGRAATKVGFGNAGAWSVPVDGIADGRHVVTFVATDAAGNVSNPTQVSFTLDTVAPAIALAPDGVRNGTILSTGAMLDGTVTTESGVALTALSYAIDGGTPMPIGFNSANAFDMPLNIGKLGIGAHSLALRATDAAGNTSTTTLNVTLPALPPLTVASLTPTVNAANVGVTYRPEITFSRAVDRATVTSSDFFATDPGGAVIPATIAMLEDNTGAYLLVNNPMPGAATITLHVDGGSIEAQADGALLDAAGSGVAGSSLTETFTTVSTASVPNTTISGIVVDPGPDQTPMSPDDFKGAPDGSLDFANDTWKLPIAGVKVYVLGQEQNAVFTDAQGRFTLTNVPVGDVKVIFDGTTATNPPTGLYFPIMTMDLPNVRAGVANTVMGSMGSPVEQAADAADPAVYLPRVQSAVLTPLSTITPTVVTAPVNSDFGSGQTSLTSQQLNQLTLTVQPGSVIDANGGAVANAQVGISPVPPAIVQDMLPAGLLQHSFDLTIQAPGGAVFTSGAALTMPNVFGLAPGQKTFVLGFDHTTGQLVIQGTATASADGLTVTTDPGSGVVAPGWHGMTPPGSDGSGGADDEWPGLDGHGLFGAWLNFIVHENQGQNRALNLLISATKVTTAIGNQAEKIVNFASNTWSAVGGGISARGGNITNVGTFSNAVGMALDTRSLVNDLSDDIRQLRQTPNPLNLIVFIGDLAHDGANVVLDGFGFVPGPLGEVASGGRAAIAVVDILQDYRNGNLPTLQTHVDAASAAVQSAGSASGHQVGGTSSALAVTTASTGTAFDAIVASVQAEAAYQQPLWQRIANDLNTLSVLDPVTALLQADGQTGFAANVSATTVQSIATQGTAILSAIQDYADALNALSGHPTIEGLEQQIQDGVNAAFAADNAAYFQDLPSSSAGIANAAGGSTTMYAALTNMTDGSVLRQTFTPANGYKFFLAPSTYYQVTVYDPSTGAVGSTSFLSGTSGTDTQIPKIGMVFDPDTPGTDGLTPAQAFAIGVDSSKVSNLVPGITDLAAIQQGLVNGSVTAGTTGIVASVPLQGSAQAVVLAGSATNAATMYAYVATGFYGLAIVDVTNAFSPTVVSQLALAGNATGIAVNPAIGIAAVADGTGGLRFINVANPAAPTLVQTVPIDATTVLIENGTAYANGGNTINAVDVASGIVLQTLDTGVTITGLAVRGTTLYSMDTSDTLRVFDLSTGRMVQKGSVVLPAGGNGLVADTGVVYVAAASGTTSGDYLTVDVSNPAAPTLIAGVANPGIAGGALALNGSGVGLAVQQIQEPPPNPGLHNVADLIDTSNTARTGQLTTRFELSAPPAGVAIGDGIGFIADGTGGLQVLNYLPPDTTGTPPSIAISSPPADVEPNTQGTQVFEGEPITVGVTVSDNVQVRNVELLVNGSVVANDVSFPFDMTASLPTIANNGGAAVTLQAEAIDTGGNTAFSATLPLTLVTDTRPLTLVSESISQGATLSQFLRAISLTFSKPIDPTTVATSTFELIGPGSQVVSPSAVGLGEAGQAVQLSYGTLAPGAYQFVVDAPLVKDFQGNALGAANLTTSFSVQQFTEVFTNLAGGSWNTPGNWSGNAVPGATDGVSVAPAAAVAYDGGTDSVTQLAIGTATVFQATSGQLSVANLLRVDGQVTAASGALAATGSVTVGASGTITVQNRATTLDNVAIAAGGGVRISDNDVLTAAGVYLNAGTIALNGIGDTTEFQIAGATTLQGGGTVTLAAAFANAITGQIQGAALTNVDNTITGGGQLGGGTLTVINQAKGVIDGTQGMVINTGIVPLSNLGTIEATNAGTLFLGGSIANGATIQSIGTNAVVAFVSGVVMGGTLTTFGGGIFATADRGGVLDGIANTLTNTGTIVVRDNQALGLRGTIDNVAGVGTISLAGFGDPTQLLIGSGATLIGGGVVNLGTNGANAVTAGTAGATLTNVDNVITGGGQLGGGTLTLINAAAGVIDGTLGMVINTGTVPLSNLGTIEATNAGTLFIGGSIANGATIQSVGTSAVVAFVSGVVMGGTLTTSGGGVFAAADRGGVLDGVANTLTNTGTIVVRDNEALGLRGTIDNVAGAGTIAMASVGDTTQLLIGASATLIGGGVVNLGTNGVNVVTAGTAGATLTNVDNVITGGGQLGGGTLTLINAAAGVIDGTLGMVINTGTVPLSNLGTIEATANGTIFLGGSIANAATIQSVGSGALVGIRSGVIMGGTLTTSGGGTIASVDGGGILDGVSSPLTNTGSIVVRDNTALGLRGTIDNAVNAGTISLASLGDSTRLLIDTSATLRGGGVVALGGNGANAITAGTAGATLVNVDNVITGGGQLGGGTLALTNQVGGVIDGTLGMVVNTGTVPLNNLGTIEATANGSIFLGGSIANSAIIQSVGSNALVGIQSGVIIGGTLTTSGGGTIASVDRFGVLDGVSATLTNTGSIVVRDNTALGLRGTISNIAGAGTISVASNGDSTQLLIDGGATLQGGGKLVLGNTLANVVTAGTLGATLTNVDNLITGGGQLGGGTLTLINKAGGIIDGTQGMVVNTGSVALSNLGTIEATANGTIFLAGSVANSATILATGSNAVVGIQSGVISGGTLMTSAGGTIASVDRGGVLDGTSVAPTNIGSIVVRDNTTLTLRGTIDNIANAGTVSMASIGDATQLLIGAGATLQGGGALVLGSAQANIVTAGIAGATLTNVDNIITGGGQLGGGTLTLINQASGVIDGTLGMVVNTGTVPLSNLGTIEATANGTIFLGGSIANQATIQAVGSKALVGIQSGVIVGGTLTTSGGGTIGSVDRGGVLDGSAATVTNLGSLVVLDNTTLTLRGTIDNAATIGINSFGNATQLLISPLNATLKGGGQVVLNGSSADVINAGTAGGTLTNADNVISGGGQLGAGQLTLVNQAGGTIDATSASTLFVNTGANAIVNSGVMESAASGGLNVNGTGGVINTGTLWADGDTLSVTGDVSGAGAGRITGAGTLHLSGTVAAGQTISFDVGATGTLQLVQSLQFHGTIAGLAVSGANALDLADIGFISGATKAAFSGGTLTVTDGTHNAGIVLAGDYTGHTFVTSSDQNGGTKVIDPAEGQSLASLLGGSRPEMPSFGVGIGPAPASSTSTGRFAADWQIIAPDWGGLGSPRAPG